MKNAYESRGAQTAEGRRVKELESENERIKAHYTKRIREVEDKYKFGNKRPPSAKKGDESKTIDKSKENS